MSETHKTPYFDPHSKAECVCVSTLTAPYCPACNPETYAVLYAQHRKDRRPVGAAPTFTFITR